MDADEQQIFNYLLTYGEQWVSGREISRRAGGKRRYAEDNEWARPVLGRLRGAGILEGNQAGRFRIKPELLHKDEEEQWVAPDIEKILSERGDGTAGAEDIELSPEESDEPS